MSSNDHNFNTLPNIDVSNPDFYNIVQQAIDYDLARLKKDIAVVTDLRMIAAEVEVETAALYHAELLYDIEDLKNATDTSIQASECDSK